MPLRLPALFILIPLSLFATAFEPNESCQSCHPAIYAEYQRSIHQNSTIFQDTIHAAVWAGHPQNLKQQRYGCGKCHTPVADTLADMTTPGRHALPDPDDASQNQGVACAYCHRITDIESHTASNTNIISPTPKHYFGNRKPAIDSPFHTISTENTLFKNGNVCIGCHSHKANKAGLNVCSTNNRNELDEANCVSCHMPQVPGSVSNLHKRETHAFHGFPGAHRHSEMLSEYVTLAVTPLEEGFNVTVGNRSAHNLLLHPLRRALLNVTIHRGERTLPLEPVAFARVIGHGGKPTPPWMATEEVENSMVRGGQRHIIRFDDLLRSGDRVQATLGYYLVDPAMLKGLGLQEDPEALRFHLLKEVWVTIP